MSEQDYIVLAEDCKNRIEEKNKQLEKLEYKNKIYKRSLNEINAATHSMFILLDILQTVTISTKTGNESILYNKINNYLSDVDQVFVSLNNGVPQDSFGAEMDYLTQYTISQM